jgi:hypothetical protein
MLNLQFPKLAPMLVSWRAAKVAESYIVDLREADEPESDTLPPPRQHDPDSREPPRKDPSRREAPRKDPPRSEAPRKDPPPNSVDEPSIPNLPIG